MIRNEYRYNPYFRKFVDEYREKNACTVEEALNSDYIRKMYYRYTEV